MTDLETPLNGWNEYKRLVLAELERLHQSVEKLREQREQVTSELADDIYKGDTDIKAQIKVLEDKLNAFKVEFHEDGKASSSWGFWGAVVGMITSLIVAIISLIVTLAK